MTDVARSAAPIDHAVTVHVYATIEGVRVSARWNGGTVAGDARLCDDLRGSLDDPLGFITACEQVVGGPVGVAIGPLARASGDGSPGEGRP